MMHKEVLTPRNRFHPLSLAMSFWLLSAVLGALVACGIWEGLEQLTSAEASTSKATAFPRVKLDLPIRLIDCGTAERSFDLFVCAVEYTIDLR